MSNDIIARILSSIRSQVDELERLLNADGATNVDATMPVFDPDVDEPPVQPSVGGNRVERDWCALMLWGRLRCLNVREGRGATREDSVLIAKAAGYQDGRAWNKWTGWVQDEDGARWMTDAGMGHLRHYYAAVGRTIPSDLV